MSLAPLRRHWALFLACAVLVPGAAVAVSLAQTKQYTATSSLLFRDPALDQKLFGTTFVQPSSDPDREAATDLTLVSLRRVAKVTAEDLGFSVQYVRDRVKAVPAGRSDVVDVSATTADPDRSATLANRFALNYIGFRRGADRRLLNDATRTVERQLSTIPPNERDSRRLSELRERRDQLEILSSLQTGNVELVQRAQPPADPSSPRTLRNAVIGLLFGLLLGALAVYLRVRTDRSVGSPEQIQEISGRPVLAAIPLASRDKMTPATLTPVTLESFRLLRANLRYFNLGRQLRTVLVTSASPAEGKSTVAANLAVAAATSGERVLLVEADLRKPTLRTRLGFEPTAGLSEVLAGMRDLGDTIIRYDVGGNNTLDCLLAGLSFPNPGELLESDRMAEFLRQVSDEYELVIVDTPPIMLISDAIPLIEHVDGVLAVARIGVTDRKSIKLLSDRLENLSANVLGFTANALPESRSPGYYGYSGGYLSDSVASKQESSAPEISTPQVTRTGGS